MPAVLASVQRAIQRPVVQSAIPVVFFALLILGAVRAYTPVPTYDMWEGALLTTFKVFDGDPREFLRFWNEHRIVFSKILFWLDLRYFDARLVFLIVTNIALLLGLWLALCAATMRLIKDRRLARIVCAGIAALTFSWLQRENIDSPFQSQFLLAYLVPLLAFLSLARATRDPRRRLWFVAALLLGAASLGTMANGLLALPLLFLMQGMLDWSAGCRSWARLGLLAVCGTVLTSLWFYGFPGSQTDPPAIVDFIAFAATFLGFPLAYVGGIAGGIIGSLLFLAAFIFVLRSAWRERKTLDPHFVAILMLIAYIGATCLITAYGRASDLANAALVARYGTPSLLAWASLAILLAAILQNRANALRVFAGTSVIVALLLLPIQFLRTAGDEPPTFVHGTMRAALALELGIPDLHAMAGAFHAPTREYADLLKSIADRLAARGVSTFADPQWDRLIAKVGTAADGAHACKSNVEAVSEVPGESRFKAVQGWAIDENARRQPRFVTFGADGAIVGIAVVGGARPDVAPFPGQTGRTSGFAGYVLTSHAGAFTVLCSENEP